MFSRHSTGNTHTHSSSWGCRHVHLDSHYTCTCCCWLAYLLLENVGDAADFNKFNFGFIAASLEEWLVETPGGSVEHWLLPSHQQRRTTSRHQHQTRVNQTNRSAAAENPRVASCHSQINPPIISQVLLPNNTQQEYTGWPKKSKPQNFVDIFAKYWPIFKIFSLLHSVKNL